MWVCVFAVCTQKHHNVFITSFAACYKLGTRAMLPPYQQRQKSFVHKNGGAPDTVHFPFLSHSLPSLRPGVGHSYSRIVSLRLFHCFSSVHLCNALRFLSRGTQSMPIRSHLIFTVNWTNRRDAGERRMRPLPYATYLYQQHKSTTMVPKICSENERKEKCFIHARCDRNGLGSGHSRRVPHAIKQPDSYREWNMF